MSEELNCSNRLGTNGSWSRCGSSCDLAAADSRRLSRSRTNSSHRYGAPADQIRRGSLAWGSPGRGRDLRRVRTRSSGRGAGRRRCRAPAEARITAAGARGWLAHCGDRLALHRSGLIREPLQRSGAYTIVQWKRRFTSRILASGPSASDPPCRGRREPPRGNHVRELRTSTSARVDRRDVCPART